MEAQPPQDLEKALKEAELAASKFEETSHLSDEEKAQAEKVEEERKRKAKDRSDMLQVLRMVEARRILFKILEKCGPYQPSFDLNSARMTDYNEGRRSIGIEVLQMINSADPQAYIQMVNEHASDEKAEKERKRKEN